MRRLRAPGPGGLRLVDLSHAIADGLRTYPGLPTPVVSTHLGRADSEARYAPGTSFHIGRIEMVANTGTYLDTPFHRFADGADLAALPLERVANLPALVVAAPAHGRAIGPTQIPACELRGHAVLFHTGWSRHFGSEAYFSGHPFLTREAAEQLVERGAALVGIDSLNIDDTADGTRPAHTLLLAAGIPIVEHLTRLDEIPASGLRFFAVPVKVRGMGTFPVRAFALIEDVARR
jgi:kynurenine formamidase